MATNQITTLQHLDMNNVVIKANSLIEGHYTMTQPESKLMEAVVAMLPLHAQDFEVLTFSTAELCEFCGINLRELKEVTKSILKQPVVFWDKTETGERREVQTVWLTSAIYYPQRGTVEIMVSPELKPYLLNLPETNRPYTAIGVKETINSTYYTKRIYELALQYKNVGRRPRMSIMELRQCLGIDDSKYSKFSHFREKVLDKAIKDIAEDKDKTYEVSYELYRGGRSFSEIELIVKRKKAYDKVNMEMPFAPNADANGKVGRWTFAEPEAVKTYLREQGFSKQIMDNITIEQMRLVTQMLEYGVNKIVLQNAIMQHGIKYVLANNAIAGQRFGNGGRNYGALFFTAIKENWAQEDRIKKQKQKLKTEPFDADKMAAAYEELEKVKQDEAAAVPVTSMMEIEIEMSNKAVQSGESSRFLEYVIKKYKDSKEPRIQEAVTLLRNGKLIPNNFFS